MFRYSPDRKSEHPDAPAYAHRCSAGRRLTPGSTNSNNPAVLPKRRAASTYGASSSTCTRPTPPIAAEALQYIDALYAIEAEIRARAPDEP
jgi:hypothetical protein